MDQGVPIADNLDHPLSVAHPDHNEGPTEEVSPFEKYDPLLHGGIASTQGRASRSVTAAAKKKEVLSISFVKKYIQYAKARPPPALTKAAADWIVDVYARLRNEEADGKKRVYSALLQSLCQSHNFYRHRRLRHVHWKH